MVPQFSQPRKSYYTIKSGYIGQYHFLGWENCGTILVPHSGDTTLYSHNVEPYWFHNMAILHDIDKMWNQIGSTWFSIELSMNWENGSTNWNQSLYFRENGSTFFSKLGKWFHIGRQTVVPQQFCNFLFNYSQKSRN